MNKKPYAITLDVGSSRANHTGSWRTERAVYVDRLPPCNNACPAGENIQAWLYEAEDGEGGYERAWRKLMEENPLLLRLKEIESLERLVEKVGRIDLHTGDGAAFDGLLTKLVRLKADEPA